MVRQTIILGLACTVMACSNLVFSAEKPPVKKVRPTKVCMGTFDSRAIAMAHFGKMIKEGRLEKLYADHAKAKAAGDEKLAKELAAKGQALQKRLHLQVFGTAPVDDALQSIKKELPKIASSAGVDVIVCIYDLSYKSPSVNTVDVTDKMVRLFNPDKKTLEKIQALLKHPPFPNEVIEGMDCSPPGKKTAEPCRDK